jgi:hypothetical protein
MRSHDEIDYDGVGIVIAFIFRYDAGPTAVVTGPPAPYYLFADGHTELASPENGEPI